MNTKPLKSSPYELFVRILAATLGSYALCWSVLTQLCAWLPFAKATVWYFTTQLAPLPFLGGLLWAFAASDARRALSWPLAIAAVFQLLTVVLR